MLWVVVTMWKLVEGRSVVGREMEGWAEKVDRERKMEGRGLQSRGEREDGSQYHLPELLVKRRIERVGVCVKVE